MSDTAQELARAQRTPAQRTIFDLIDRQKPEIERVLGKAMDAERLTRIVQTEMRRTPLLLECTPDSLLGAMMLSAQLGLEPGPLGLVYLVPYENKRAGRKEVTFILGYKGMVALAYRSGGLKDIQAHTVHEGDVFEFERRAKWHILHREAAPADRGAVVCYYAVANLVGGGTVAGRLWPADVEARRLRSASGRVGKGPWDTDYDAMARKSVIRSMQPYLPLVGGFARGVTFDESVVDPDELGA